MKKQDIIDRAYRLFTQFEKPKHSTNHTHCEECLEHDETLRNVKRRELTVNHIGTLGWGPLPFLLPSAMAYYMPRLVELALENVNNKEGDPYIPQFVNQTGSDPDRECYSLFSAEHKYIIYLTFEHINEKYREIVEEECWENDLEEALSRWRA